MAAFLPAQPRGEAPVSLIFVHPDKGPMAIIANGIVDLGIEVIGHVLAAILALQFSSGGLLFTQFLAILADLIVELRDKVIRHVHVLAEDALQRFLVGFRFRWPYNCVLHERCLLFSLGLGCDLP
jgi:hypothetical protein